MGNRKKGKKKALPASQQQPPPIRSIPAANANMKSHHPDRSHSHRHPQPRPHAHSRPPPPHDPFPYRHHPAPNLPHPPSHRTSSLYLNNDMRPFALPTPPPIPPIPFFNHPLPLRPPPSSHFGLPEHQHLPLEYRAQQQAHAQQLQQFVLPAHQGFVPSQLHQFDPPHPIPSSYFGPPSGHLDHRHSSAGRGSLVVFMPPMETQVKMPAMENIHQVNGPRDVGRLGVGLVAGGQRDREVSSSTNLSLESSESSRSSLQRRQLLIRGLVLKPIECPTDVVEIILATSSATFTIHHALLSHFSPYFRQLFTSLNLPCSEKETEKIKTKTIGVKKYKYANELDFLESERGVSMPMDLYAEFVDGGGNVGGVSCEKGKEGDIGEIEVEVKVNIPNLAAKKPVKIVLEKDVVGVVSEGAFGALVCWCYLGVFEVSGGVGIGEKKGVEKGGLGIVVGDGEGNTDGKGRDGGKVDPCTLIELWVLAGRLGMKSCQNDCIVAIEMGRRRRDIIETGMLKWVYANTTDYGHRNEDCTLRNLLIDQCAWLLDESWLLRTGEDGVDNASVFPREALLELVTRMRVLLRGGKGLDLSIGKALERIEERKGDRYFVVEDEGGIVAELRS